MKNHYIPSVVDCHTHSTLARLWADTNGRKPMTDSEIEKSRWCGECPVRRQ